MRSLLLIVLAGLVAVLIFRVERDGRVAVELAESATLAPVTGFAQAPVETGVAENGQASEVVAESEVALQPVRRVVHVPGQSTDQEAAPDLESWSVEDRHLEAYAKHNLDLALAEDFYAAIRMEKVLERCREAPESLAELDQHVERRINMYARARELLPEMTSPDILEIRKRNLDRFESCQFFKGLFNDDLRERLADLAGQGHVTARYLYAMWPPLTKGRPDGFFVHQEWAEKALAFSLANLAESEMAGLMAFARGYQKPGMFTTYDPQLGIAFEITAQDCGLDIPAVAKNIEDLLNDAKFPLFVEDFRHAVLAMAEGLNGFCR